MKIYIMNQEPIYIDEERGVKIQQALLNGAEYISIDGELYKSSVVAAITKESEPRPVQYGKYIPTKLKEIVNTNLKPGEGLEKYKQRREELGL